MTEEEFRNDMESKIYNSIMRDEIDWDKYIKECIKYGEKKAIKNNLDKIILLFENNIYYPLTDKYGYFQGVNKKTFKKDLEKAGLI
jgi:hypothetical protein